MGVRAHASQPLAPRVRSRGPALASTIVVVLLAFLLLVANGRALSAPPSSWLAGLVLSAALAVAGVALDVDATGASLLGKALAALFAACAAGALFSAVARRHGPAEGRWAGVVLALGTTLASAAQAWSGEAAATFAVALAVLLLVRAEDEDRALPAAQAGLPLGLAVALQPTTAPLALVLALAVIARWRAASSRATCTPIIRTGTRPTGSPPRWRPRALTRSARTFAATSSARTWCSRSRATSIRKRWRPR